MTGRTRTTTAGIRTACTAMLLAGTPLALAGCDLPTNTTEKTVVDDGLPYEQSTKLAAYYQAINSIDLDKMKRDYAEREIGKAKAGDTPYINSYELEMALQQIQRARATEGALGPVDAAADRLLRPFEALVSRAKGLDSYFTTRGYLTDGYARARAEDAPMLSGFDAAIAAYAPFVAAVEQATEQQETVYLRRMQAEGRMHDYYDIMTVRQVRAIRAATPPPPSNADRVAGERADKLVAELTALLDKSRAARAAAIAKAPVEERATLEMGPVSVAEQFIGAYREYRSTGKPEDYQKFRDAASGVFLQAA